MIIRLGIFFELMAKESLLWKVTKKDSLKEHFILGTMHVKSDEAYTPVAVAKMYMEQCNFYAGEMNMNDPDLSFLGDNFVWDIHLRDLIGGKKYSKYKRIISKSYGIDLDQIAYYKPLIITNMITETQVTKNYDLALDSFLWQYAQAREMKMRGLESAKRQFEIMDLIPIKLS